MAHYLILMIFLLLYPFRSNQIEEPKTNVKPWLKPL